MNNTELALSITQSTYAHKPHVISSVCRGQSTLQFITETPTASGVLWLFRKGAVWVWVLLSKAGYPTLHVDRTVVAKAISEQDTRETAGNECVM